MDFSHTRLPCGFARRITTSRCLGKKATDLLPFRGYSCSALGVRHFVLGGSV
jgi:hypothetical protein